MRQSLGKILRWGLGLIGLTGLVFALGFGPLFLEDEPRVKAGLPPSPEDVAAARKLVRDIRSAAADSSERGGFLRVDEAQMNSAIQLVARFVSEFQGRISVGRDAVLGEASLPVSWWNGQKWLNFTGRVPTFEDTFVLSEIKVGPTQLPPRLALGVARVGANLYMGDRFGDRVLAAATAMQIVQHDLIFRITLDDVGKNGMMRSAFGGLRGREMPDIQQIDTYYSKLRTAMESGDLDETGSFLPYLMFSLHAALEQSNAQTLPNAYTAAIFALARACGARDFAMIVGSLAFDAPASSPEWSTHCDEVTFNGRIDSRRHFITSAALQAASNTGVSISLGEFKELYDSISGAGGFDFTDMAANLSGIRMSNLLMTAPPETWRSKLADLETENDVIVPFEGIPQLLPEAAFKARFGNVDDPRYTAMITEIARRIDEVKLYRAP